MKTLREIIEQGANDLGTYKNPNVREVQDRLDQLLHEAGLGSIGGDKLESIDIYEDEFWIETSHFIRGCSGSDTYHLPTSIIDAEDPVMAAKMYGLERKIEQATACMNTAQKEMERQKGILETLMKEKAQLEDKGSPL